MKLLRVVISVLWILLGLAIGGLLLSEFPSEHPINVQEHITWVHRFDELFYLLTHIFLVYAGVVSLVRLKRPYTLGKSIIPNRALRLILGVVFMISGFRVLSTLATLVYTVESSGLEYRQILSSFIIWIYLFLLFVSLGAVLVFSKEKERI